VPAPRDGYPRRLETIGDHLKKRRLDIGLNRREAAARIGADPDTMRNWEEGQTKIETRSIPAIIRFIGYNPSRKREHVARRSDANG
jgi:DNA-binding XRE family transcriptional regulator